MASAAAPPGIRRGARQRFLGAVLALAALLSLVDFAAAACSYDLALPDAGLSVAATSVFAGAVNNPLPTIGVCPPYAASPTSLSGATCSGITVQPNAVLAFGTCALPGAACTGATRLTLLSSAGATLSDVNRATATSFTASYAKFAQGCVLGARCSYGEWRNTGVSAANVSILERCWGGDTSCTGIAAWRLTNPASPAVEAVTSAGLAAASPKTVAAVTTPITIAFVISPARNATLTKISGTAAAGAPVTISIMPYSAYDPGQLASLGNSTVWAGNWTTLYSSPWPGSGTASVQQVTFIAPFSVTAGTNYTVMVSTNNQTSTTTLTCLHWLGNVTSTLFSDSTLTVYQGGGFSWPAFNYNNSFFPTKMCAWNKLVISYDQQLDASCAPPPPPPSPPPIAIPTNAPAALVASLDDLIRALANTNVTSINIRAAIRLNSTLTIAVDLGTTRTLTIIGTPDCNNADPRVLLCSLDAGGLSSVMTVPNNVSLTIGNLAIMNGLSAAGVSGGCILADCATCSLTISAAVFTNCTARTTGNGGAIIMRNRGALTVRNSLFQQNTAAHGGAIMVFNATATITGTTFSYNTATIATTSTTVVAASDLFGPSGGALSLQVATATVTGCTFTSNQAMSSDFVLVANPDLPQARGGGLFISQSINVVVSGSTFSGNQAYYGGGVYAVSTPQLQLLSSVLTNNTASLGDGGGAYLQDCINATVADSLVASNAAGGHMGGGLAAFNSQKVNLLTVVRSSFSFNSAPSGCGGGLGFDTPVILIINQSTVISGNTARSGGGLCCNLCTRIDLQNSFLFNNVATLVGGGAMAVANAPSYLVNVSMSFNSAPQGGAIFSTSSYFKCENSSLTNNTATTTHGGAISHASLDDGKQDLILLWTNLTGNTCEGGGGAVAAFSTRTLVLNNCNLLYNSIYGDSPMGGAVMALGITRMFMRNSTASYNTIAVVPTLTTSSPLGFVTGVNAIGAGNGGALWIGNALRVPIAIIGCTFTFNSAPSAGAIYVTGSVRLDIQLSTFEHDHSVGYASRGGAIVSTQSATVDVADTSFYSCESNGGGVAWHGGTTASTYTRVLFDSNEGIPGFDATGTVLQIAESSFVNITDSTFLNNIGKDLADGTVAFVGDNTSSLYISNTLFDGNFAYLGGCLFTTVASQAAQMHLSGVTFTNSFAFAGSVLFTEAVDFAPLDCSPVPCDTSDPNNFASNYGQVYATPPTQFNIDIPDSIRSGAPLPVIITLVDGFGTLVSDWTNTVATIESLADISGSLRTFYQHGQATFANLVLHGDESQSYNMTFSISGPKLFGNNVDSQSMSKSVEVQACEPGETFDTRVRECACAAGYGLIKTDNTCRACAADEVVPDGSLSCTACPVLSIPVSPTTCECIPGYFGAITGASGVCTLCPEDSYRSANDSAIQCLPCPETSHTFHLGAVSKAECLCSADAWNDGSGVNGSVYCAAVPVGGWAPEADTRMYAVANYWRPNGEYPQFYQCTTGMCNREEPDVNVSVPMGHACRTGHTGHLCAVCIEQWSYQGAYCASCDPTQAYLNWSGAKRGGVVFIGLAIVLVFLYFIFFLPLSPRLDDFLRGLISPATAKLEKMLGDVAKSARPASAGGARPMSAKAAAQRQARRSSHSKGAHFHVPHADHDDKRHESSFTSPAPRLRVHRRSRILVFLDLIQEPIRIVVTFWQIISSFSANLYVPWPSIYYSLANALNVVSLDFLRLPDIACLDPGVSYYTIFNGVTITTFVYIVFCMLTYYYGARTSVALEDIDRRRRFKTQCLNAFIWGIFLVYPQVASTTLSIFACDELENRTFWLMADYRLQCYTPTHRLYIGIGAMWTLLLPFGLPASFLYLLYQAGVPELSRWKRECGWLRSIAQRALVLGVPMDGLEFDPDTLTLESISTTHLRLLHRVFVNHELEAILADKARPSVTGPSAVTERTLAEALKEHLPKLRIASMRMSAANAAAANGDVAPTGPPDSGEGSKRGEHTMFDLSSSRHKQRRANNSTLWEAALARREKMQTIFAKIRIQLGVAAALRNRGIRRRLSMLFYRNERELLIMQLLDWARHDTTTLVAEPRQNQLRWRTHYEWHSLRVDNVPLSDRDKAERNAFFKYRFLFAAYAVHAWYWEAIDMGQKLFLTSIISFIAPRSSVQIIVATMFTFGMVLFTTAVKPYRERANNQLVSLSQVNLFLFMFTGFLLRTNPEGISDHRTLFAVVVGALTTSIIAFSFFLFLRELSRQLLNALIDIQDDEDADEEAAWEAEEDEWTDESYTDDEDMEDADDDDDDNGSALALRPPLTQEDALASGFVPEGDMATGDPNLGGGVESDAEEGGGQDDESAPAPAATRAASPGGTPPPPAWVSRLAS